MCDGGTGGVWVHARGSCGCAAVGTVCPAQGVLPAELRCLQKRSKEEKETPSPAGRRQETPRSRLLDGTGAGRPVGVGREGVRFPGCLSTRGGAPAPAGGQPWPCPGPCGAARTPPAGEPCPEGGISGGRFRLQLPRKRLVTAPGPRDSGISCFCRRAARWQAVTCLLLEAGSVFPPSDLLYSTCMRPGPAPVTYSCVLLFGACAL